MFNFLKTLVGSATSSAAPRESISAGHGVHASFSKPAVPTTLPPDRRGRLKNGNGPGDFLAAPRCGARTRCGGACRQPAMTNGRCRMHGGLSTGPRTPEGLAAPVAPASPTAATPPTSASSAPPPAPTAAASAPSWP